LSAGFVPATQARMRAADFVGRDLIAVKDRIGHGNFLL
jgi:hypothetical protein